MLCGCDHYVMRCVSCALLSCVYVYTLSRDWLGTKVFSSVYTRATRARDHVVPGHAGTSYETVPSCWAWANTTLARDKNSN